VYAHLPKRKKKKKKKEKEKENLLEAWVFS